MLRARSGFLIAYAVAVLLTIVVMVSVLRVWESTLQIPLIYWGDATAIGAHAKSIIDNGWYFRNPYLGAPSELTWGDVPMTEGLHFLVLKLLSVFTSSYGEICNLYYYLSFPLTSVISLFVFLRLGLQLPYALTASLLYTFLPFHFFRSVAHLFLVYYLVPLAVFVALEVFKHCPPFFENGQEDYARFRWRTIRAGGYALLCLVLGASGVYYVFFSGFLLLTAGVLATLVQRRWAPLVSAGVLLALISTSVLINLVPVLSYRMTNGSNPQVIERSPGHAERYGLKIAQLLLPVSGHRIPTLAQLKATYNRDAPLVNENNHATLGVIGSLGFLSLVAAVFLPKALLNSESRLIQMSRLNLAAVLLASIGAFGSILAVTISPMIRAYNRISVFIAFFSLLGFFLIVQHFLARYAPFKKWQPNWILAAVLLGIGLFDQTTAHYAPPYARTAAAFENDADFVKRIEAAVPERSMIFQLPYVPFPENPPLYSMVEFEHFKGYLHSRTLRWSYGAMRGREIDSWQQAVSREPAPDLVRHITAAGFVGVYLNRRGYPDGGVELERQLSQLVRTPPIESADRALAFYDVRP